MDIITEQPLTEGIHRFCYSARVIISFNMISFHIILIRNSNRVRLKIASGGQTGVDRAALDAAMTTETNCGGCCPEGHLPEDGMIPLLKGAGYRERTRQNVADSDGTVVIYLETSSGGTEQTLQFGLNRKKPYLLIDATEWMPKHRPTSLLFKHSSSC